MRPSLALTVVSTASALVASAVAHSSLLIPTSRNALIDKGLPEFADGKSPTTPCTCANGLGNGGNGNGPKPCDMGIRKSGGSGQPCLWWSQGCSINCQWCATNMTDGVIPTAPVTGNAPHTDKAGFRKSYCNTTPGFDKDTLPREAWTMNIHAIRGSADDSYRYNPWRSPGSAPIVDPCGQAGGKYTATPVGGDSVYYNTSRAAMGDMGSKLPVTPDADMPTWVAGTHVDVAWGMRYNHGGGYQYRLCPADEPLTEACFMKMPLDFNRSAHRLIFNNGSLISYIKGMFVTTGVNPAGSTWARNPIPRTATDNRGMSMENCKYPGKYGCPTTCDGKPRGGMFNPTCTHFEPPCPQDQMAHEKFGNFTLPWSTDGSGQGTCSGDWTLGMIADKVILPKDIKPGKYVLGWRNDCEETAQVWQNCADVKIVAQ